jgi:DNA-binding transcriptional LysR family regulator
MQEYDLSELRSFITVVETGSFAKAAEQLDISTAAVSRRIASLEVALGSQLISRTTRRLDLTDAGKMFYEDVIHVFQMLDEADERVRAGRESIQGTLRIATPLSFGFEKVAPLLPKLMRLYPGLKVTLKLEDRLTDLQAEGIDVAVRIGMMPDSTLVATQITSIGKICCASPGYLKAHGTPTQPQHMTAHKLLHYSNISMKDEWSWLFRGTEPMPDMSYEFAANNAEALRALAIEGMGITVLPAFSVEDALKKGSLVQIFKNIQPAPSPLYAVRVSRQYTPARVRAFIEFLKSEFHNNT